jgi:hypothetical protein
MALFGVSGSCGTVAAHDSMSSVIRVLTDCPASCLFNGTWTATGGLEMGVDNDVRWNCYD